MAACKWFVGSLGSFYIPRLWQRKSLYVGGIYIHDDNNNNNNACLNVINHNPKRVKIKCRNEKSNKLAKTLQENGVVVVFPGFYPISPTWSTVLFKNFQHEFLN